MSTYRLDLAGLCLRIDTYYDSLTGRESVRLIAQDPDVERRDHRRPGEPGHGIEIWIEPSENELTPEERATLTKYQRGKLLRSRVQEPLQVRAHQAERPSRPLPGPLYRR